jgi:hypothetical protein
LFEAIEGGAPGSIFGVFAGAGFEQESYDRGSFELASDRQHERGFA